MFWFNFSVFADCGLALVWKGKGLAHPAAPPALPEQIAAGQ